jgi:phosphoserine / homoserine phosphotransferase
VILSDTFQEFARPIMRQLEWPTLFCNSLEVDSGGRITDYRLRQENGKQAAVRAFATMNLTVYAAGDSWNDLTMIQEAQKGAFFQPPDSIRQAHPEIPVCMDYTELQHFLLN